ncbi:MAG: elongation factor P, partial [Rhodospirillaceae bacterium]|nr:elongation factor P [Rhodospirillaceae bacterium]
MRINGNAIRPGMVVEHQGRLWVAVKIQHTQPGKGGAYLQVELKDIRDGTKLNERFRSSENVERVRLDEKPHQFLFADDDLLTFMDTETYDQVSLPKASLGDGVVFLQDGMEVIIESHEGEPLSVQLPASVTLEVMETEPVVKGQTAAASYKPAILDN